MTYPGAPGQPAQPPQGPYAQQQYPPQAYYPPPTPAPRKRRKWPWIVGGAAALLLVIAVAGGGGQAPAGSTSTAGGSAPAVSSSAATVVYEITGSGRASNVTYNSDGGGSIAQEAGVKLPWRKEISVDRGFAITTVSAQNAGSGQITCRILVDGEVVKENTSSGQYSIVTCTGDPI